LSFPIPFLYCATVTLPLVAVDAIPLSLLDEPVRMMGLTVPSKQLLQLIGFALISIVPVSDVQFLNAYDTTMKKLLENDFLRRVQNGVYQVNAKYIVKGNENKRRMVIDYYNDLDNSYVKNDESTAKND
jgi:hypothetical protein